MGGFLPVTYNPLLPTVQSSALFTFSVVGIGSETFGELLTNQTGLASNHVTFVYDNNICMCYKTCTALYSGNVAK